MLDDRDRIFFAREGQQGSPQTLIHIPLDTPTSPRLSDADEAPSLMLLIDSSVGIGGGTDSNGKAAIPQLEALLSALSLGLALTDRDGRFLFANKAFLRAIEREQKMQGNRQVVTEVKVARVFWPAENYHQRYLQTQSLQQLQRILYLAVL